MLSPIPRGIVRFREGLPLAGRIRFRVLAAATGLLVAETRIENVITDAWKNHLRDGYRGLESDFEIKYMMVGTGTTAPDAGDTQLDAEVFRKQVTKQTAGAVGILTTTVFLAPGEANLAIKEVGWAGGPDATGAPDSGVLVARIAWDHDKNSSQSVQADREDDIG